jgi:hypothetical protein
MKSFSKAALVAVIVSAVDLQLEAETEIKALVA